MHKRLLLLILALLLSAPGAFGQRSHSTSSHAGSSTKSSSSKPKPVHVRSYTRKDGTVVRAHNRSLPGSKEAPPEATVRSSSSPTVLRDSRGRIKRSEEAKREFERQSGYPQGRPGYVVDHINPLACGGADSPENMQWQTVAEAKAKDKTERIGCR